MPELKHTFMKGRMNKDLDERLVPNGEYRNAENVEVLTSEGSNVGSVQTCLGNSQIVSPGIVPGSSCVGSIVDEKSNASYWFVSSPIDTFTRLITKPPANKEVFKDMILEHKDGVVRPVLVDIYKIHMPYTSPYTGLIGVMVQTFSISDVDSIKVGMEITFYTSLGSFNRTVTMISGNTITVNEQFSNSSYITHISFQWREGPVLHFHRPRELRRFITGINIIDGMLVWTDNFSEPKKINISRSIDGTDISGDIHSDLIVNDINEGPIFHSHVTVIRKGPLSPPSLEMSAIKNRINPINEQIMPTTSTLSYNWWGLSGTGYAGGLYPVGTISSTANTVTTSNPTSAAMGFFDVAVDFRVGDILLCTNDSTLDLETFTDYKIKLLVISSDSTAEAPVLVQDPVNGNLNVEIIDIDQTIEDKNENWYVRLESGEPLYELKFPKFAYRYRYEDGEYSTFSPFSEIAFIPKNFEYHPKEGYNLGMVNNLRSLAIKDFVPKEIPLDVVEVDILYKESDSPNIYTVKTFNPTDAEWGGKGTGSNKGSFSIEGDLIHAVVPSSQFLRHWDNVPKAALSQEVTGNRLIYGNYVQNYNLIDVNRNEISPRFDTFIKSQPPLLGEPIKSLKSLRTYQVGVVYKDFYGRETPVLSHSTGIIKIPGVNAENSNELYTQITSNPPEWAESFKFFVKETANEYYNLAMDRWYDAGDENIWLSFPSEDRNKVDDETTLILKKGDSETGFVEQTPKYKILAIENEAPDYIKTTRNSVGYMDMETDAQDVGLFYPTGNDGTGFPLVDRRKIKITGAAWEDSDFASLQNRSNDLNEGVISDNTASLQLRILDGPPTAADSTGTTQAERFSKWYDITNIAAQPQGAEDDDEPPSYFSINIDDPETGGGFGNDVLWATSGDDTVTSITADTPKVWVEICKKTIENKPEFDGRFFVKILSDGAIQNNIKGTQINIDTNQNFTEVNPFNVYYLSGQGTGAPANLDQPTDRDLASGTLVSANLSVTPYMGDNFDPLNNPLFGSNTTPPWKYNPNTTGSCDPTELGPHGHLILDANDNIINIKGYISMQIPTAVTQAQGEMVQEYKIWHTSSWSLTADEISQPYAPGGESADMHPNAFWFGSRTSRYPSSGKGHKADQNANTVMACDSQARVSLPYRSKSQWSSLYDENAVSGGFWFIDSEMAIKSFTEIDGDFAISSGTGGQQGGGEPWADVTSFWLSNRWGAGIGQSWIDISFVGEDIDSDWNFPSGSDNKEIADRLVVNSVFRFVSDTDKIAYQIKDVYNTQSGKHGSFRHWNFDVKMKDELQGLADSDAVESHKNEPYARRITWRILLCEVGDPTKIKTIGDGGTSGSEYSPVELSSTNEYGKSGEASESNSVGIEFLEPYTSHQRSVIPADPAIWETEPKEDVGLDVYYEASDTYPVVMDITSDERYIQVGATVSGSNIESPNNIIEEKRIFDYYTYQGNIDITIRDTTYDISTNGRGVGAQGIPDVLDENLLWGGYHERNWPLTAQHGPFTFGCYVYGSLVTDSGIIHNQFLGMVANIASGNRFKLVGPYDNSWANIGVGNNYLSSNAPLNHFAIPVGSELTFTNVPRVTNIEGQGGMWIPGTNENGTLVTIAGYERCNWDPTANSGTGACIGGPLASVGDVLTFTNPRGGSVSATVLDNSISYNIKTDGEERSGSQFSIENKVHGQQLSLPYFNCYSFGNGAESNRIKDLYNAVIIDKGVKASTTIAEQYKEERRGSGLIFSGIYNSKIAGINRLNQFIMAESITKDLNPSYGSIQKLHQRDSNLITLCEDKILKIYANKDALYNADGTTNLTATNRVLGQAEPFAGEFGISKNPESFASESYRAYFADRQRGAVMRLSRDGLTPISDHGMKDFFSDEFKNMPIATGFGAVDNIIGSYDSSKSLYNVSWEASSSYGYGPKTVSFREQNKGWTSFKSFFPETAFSLNSSYYSTHLGELWLHHDANVERNSIYNTGGTDTDGNFHPAGTRGTVVNGDWIDVDSSIRFLLNDNPGTIKSFNTLNYEGSQSKILLNAVGVPGMYGTVSNPWDGQYYNNIGKDGWFISSITTDKQTGTVKEFIEKEGKWFSYIQGEDTFYRSEADHNIDTKEFSVQGIGNLGGISWNCVGDGVVNGCTDPMAVNYDGDATCDDNSCCYTEGFVEPSYASSIVDMNLNTYIATGFTIVSNDTAFWDGSLADQSQVVNGVYYMNNIMLSVDIVANKIYTLVLKISNYDPNGTGDLGVSTNGGPSGGARMAGDGTYTENFVATGGRLDLFGRDTNSADIQLWVIDEAQSVCCPHGQSYDPFTETCV